MYIRVSGTGSLSCKALSKTTKQVISELDCDTSLVKEEDLLKIVEYNSLWFPALVIDKKVASIWKKLSLAEKEKTGENQAEEIHSNYIEDFHETQRCSTCRTIEINIVPLLNNLYSLYE